MRNLCVRLFKLSILLFAWRTSSVLAITCFAMSMVAHANTSLVSLAYVKVDRPPFAGVPGFLEKPEVEGIQGALSALNDANKTGKFLGYQLVMEQVILPRTLEMDEVKKQNIQKATAILIDADPEVFEKALTLLSELNANAIYFNIRNHDNGIRAKFCDSMLVHTSPSYQMKSDALGQWFRTKRVEDILVIVGPNIEDKMYSESFKTTAKLFKLDIVEQKDWQFSFDLRRSAFSEIPIFTRSRDKYEAVFVADYAQQFAYSLAYNTDILAPITGDAGLQALGWHETHEQWGARQLQNRFKESYGRAMTEYDYFAYTAVIAVSTAIQTATEKTGQTIYDSLLIEETPVAAYKGRKLTFRPETRQLRQPLLLAHEGALVTSAPLPGFLHQTNDLDTLGANLPGCENQDDN